MNRKQQYLATSLPPKKTEKGRRLETPLLLPLVILEREWGSYIRGAAARPTVRMKSRRTGGAVGKLFMVLQALHSLLPNSSCPNQTPFYGAERSLKRILDKMSNLISLRRLKSETISWEEGLGGAASMQLRAWPSVVSPLSPRKHEMKSFQQTDLKSFTTPLVVPGKYRVLG